MAGPGYLVGQDLIDGTNSRLAGYQNAIDSDALLSFLNEAKDDVWALLKNLHTEYFETSSQNTDPTQVNFFPLDQYGNQLAGNTLQTNLRQYTLPADLREIKWIEEQAPGFQHISYRYSPIDSEEWRLARQSANIDPSITPNFTMHFTISGANQFVLAEYPQTTLMPTLWYIRSLMDFQAMDQLDQILFPYSKKMMDYAAKKTMLALQDAQQWENWAAQWREDLHMVETGASPRNQMDAEYVQDFLG
jgi:hypothetical protein